jgi:hypothetical protein
MCASCVDYLTASIDLWPAECRQLVWRATELLEARMLCDPLDELPNCESELFGDRLAAEAFIFDGAPTKPRYLTPLRSAGTKYIG